MEFTQCRVSFDVNPSPKKDVAQVSAAVAAHDLGSFSVSVEMSFYCTFDFVIKNWASRSGC
jgi:hypothetical protein